MRNKKREKVVCKSEDEKLELSLVEVIKNQQRELKIMAATIADAVAKIAELKTGIDGLAAKQETFKTEVVNAFNRLEAKIIAAADAQPVVDALAPLAQTVADKTAELDAAIAAAQVTGV